VSPSNTVVRIPITFAATPVTSHIPTIAGTAKVGNTLTASSDPWGPGTVELTYEWYADDAPVGTGTTLTLTEAMLGASITVKATGTKSGYTSVTETSAAVTVAPGTLTAATPTISGTPKVGHLVKVVTGTWTPGTAFTYQWYADGTAIAGATAPTLRLTSALRGKAITVTVLGAKGGFVAVSKTSPSVAVGTGTLGTAAPRIVGTLRVGHTLKAVVGDWSPGGITFTYQWYANGTAISTATKSTLTLKSAQLGKSITVKVTGKKSGYTTVTRTSANSAPVRR
jgi:hypothetical protein